MNEIIRVLQTGERFEKIRCLKLITNSTEKDVINAIIDNLDAADIQIRGEAFSVLFINENDISEILINRLNSDSKNVRGFLALILANRNDIKSVEFLEKMINDQSGMVRSCVVGALGYLGSKKSVPILRRALKDENIEVRKSAIESLSSLGEEITEIESENLRRDADEELLRMIFKNQTKSGPGGI